MKVRFFSRFIGTLKLGRRALFIVPLIGVIAVSILSLGITRRLIEDEQRVAYTYEFIAKLNNVLAQIHNSDTDINLAIDRGDSKDDALKTADTLLHLRVEELNQLTAAFPSQQSKVAELRQMIEGYFTALNAADQNNYSGLTFEQALGEQQAQLSSTANIIIGQMTDEANNFLVQHRNSSTETEQTALATLFVISAVSIIFLSVIFYLLNRQMTRRAQVASALAESEQRLRIQYKSLPVPTYTWQKIGDNLVLVDCNDAALEATQGQIRRYLGGELHEMYPGTPGLTDMLELCFDQHITLRWDMPFRYVSTGVTRHLAFTSVFIAPDSVMVHADDITDRIQTQDAVTREHNLLRTVIDNLPDYIFAKDKNGYFILTNSAHAQAANVTPAAMVGKTAYDLFPRPLAEQFSLDDEATLQSGLALINVERATRDAEGNKRNVLTSKVPLRDGQGNVIGLVGISRDITDRKQMEEKLEEERTLLRTVLDGIPDYIYVKNTRSQFIAGNRKTRLGTASWEDVLGKTDFDIHAPDLAAQYFAEEQVMMQSGEPLFNEEQVIIDPSDNSPIYILSTKVPLRNSDGEIIGLVGINRDITELKKTQEALKASQALSGSIVASLTEAIILRYTDGTLQFMNPSAERVIETLVRDGAGRPYYFDDNGNILSSDSRPTAIALSTGRPQRDMLMRVKRLDGEIRWMSISAQPLFRSGETTPYATLSSFSDITERMRLEEALSEALDQALEASRAKSTFLATMSHEIRTPMNGVIGMTDLVLDTPLSDEQREMIEIIRTSANGLLTIINDILDFSKIEAGKLNLETVDFEPTILVENAADVVMSKAHEKKLSLITYVDPAIPPVLGGDIMRLQQIMINLMGNAVKFTEKGEIVVRANLEERDTNHAVVRFSVTDTGIGLSESARERLFQPFMQADDTMTRRYGGTGLGLAISARLVELMNGNIAVESQEGEGSVFWFSVRLEIREQFTPMQPPDLKGLRTLIVGGSPASRDILTSYMTAWNSTPEAVANGSDVQNSLWRAAATNHPYDAVIIDSALPDMDGQDLADAIKSNGSISSTHLILLTEGHKGYTGFGQDVLFSATLSKPVKQQQLVQVLDGLSRQPIHRNGSAPAFVSTAITETGSQVLLVEDNLINQKVAAMQLKKLGMNVQIASNGQEALAVLVAGTFTLILMDCQMPVVDGFEATRQIRLREAGSACHIPIIAMTANAMQGDREECLAVGMDDYISKPINLAQLQSVLEKWLPNS